MITAETLKKFCPKMRDADVHATALEAARATSSVTSVRRLCHFLGQVCVETAGITVLEENLNYRNPERLDFVFGAVRGIDVAPVRAELPCSESDDGNIPSGLA